LISHARAVSLGADVSEGLKHIRRSPGRLLQPGILALTRKLLMMLILFLVSMAFRYPFPLDTLVASFSTSYLFTIASVTPSGVGFVEGAMTVYTAALGVPLATSAAISLAYRGLTFWLTLAYGLVAIRWVGYPPQEARDKRGPGRASAEPAPSLRSALVEGKPQFEAGSNPHPVTAEGEDSPVSPPDPGS
jgi:uncharacterized membrane protein YbhN (UPF0104 family)